MSAPPVDAQLIAQLERLIADAAAQPGETDLHRRLGWLVDLLIARGQLAPGHRRMIDKISDGRPPIRLAVVQDKRTIASADVDCASLLPLCRGRCCSFSVSLSAEDVNQGRLRWNLEQPYVMRKNPTTNYCENLQRDGGCSVYDDRPATCRSYDCRNDQRVWLDFAAKIPAPMSQPVVALGEWPEDL